MQPPAVSDTQSEIDRAYVLLGTGQLAEAEDACRRALARTQERDAGAWIALGVVLRAGQRAREAEAAYGRALRLDPSNRIALHNLGALLSQEERAEEALDALERARVLGLNASELYINLGRTLVQLYRPEDAERAYEQAVALQPQSPQAQQSLAALRHMRGDTGFARDMERAIAATPHDPRLQLAYADLLRRSGDLAASEAVLRRQMAAAGPQQAAFRSSLATVLREAGRPGEAEQILLELAAAHPLDAVLMENLVATQLTLGRTGEALPFILNQRQRAPLDQRWITYEANAIRQLDPGRYHELFDYERLVRAYDIEAPAPWRSVAELNAALVEVLQTRHLFATHPLDQSLRNGTQTARTLLTDRDETIQALLNAFVPVIAEYRSAIGFDANHPLTSRNRGDVRFRGCWSVALHRGGFHVNHIHPQGWISSAYYVSVPGETADPIARSGWIKFGEPRWPSPDAAAEHFIQPKAGRLVLFPSYLWHGTVALQGPETRLSVAFDAVPS
ncbi:MAG TPA: putative 2OG-Fe(II) oxygenase [Steroidobacteraceae bacterium]|nr:putative 2OG-Fe(II) oxygenase [Steroidobacteraceae bacterium]